MDVKTLCLGVLSLHEASGYEIKKVFEQAFRHFFVAGFGSIYPALAELDRQGLVSCTSVEQEKRPAKKVYRLTDAGRTALVSAMGSAEPHHRVRSEFLVLLFFAHLLPRERLAQILDQRIALLAAEVSELEGITSNCSCPGAPGPLFTAGLGLAVSRAALDYMCSHRDGLLAELADGGSPIQPEMPT